MTPITARNSNKKCNGFRGCGEVIFTGEQYYKLRRKKALHKDCVNVKPNDNDELTRLTKEWTDK